MAKVMEIVNFSKHLTESIPHVMESMENGYDEKFNVELTHNGETLSLELNADLYDSLMKMLSEESEYAEE